MRVGALELLPVLDARGAGPLADLWPDVAQAAWEAYRPLYPELFDGAHWCPPVTCYVIRARDTTVLVDTGLGELDWFVPPQLTGRLIPSLAAEGIAPDDVDVVVITHLHVDHIGTNLAFERARFLMHPEAIAAARQRADQESVAGSVLPLLEEGRVDELGDGAEIAPGVFATTLEGHDSGHIGVRIGADAVLIADAVAHPAMLDQPEWHFVGDLNPSASAATRARLADELADSETLVVCGHFPGTGIGRVRRDDGRVVWREEHP